MGKLDNRQRYIVKATAEGESVNSQPAHLQVSPPAICSRRHTIAKRAWQFWGDSVLADAGMLPLWRKEMERG